MPPVDSFNTNVTSVQYPWPANVSPVERVFLSAHGDLQRLLSAFFNRRISIDRIYAETTPRTHPASPSLPIMQKRQVNLVCSNKVVCVATSTVTMTSPETERLFLDEKFAIGQLFRRMQTIPQFNLLEVGMDEDSTSRPSSNPKGKLWRRYTLHMDGFYCEIVESFEDRSMFTRGEAWLEEVLDTVTLKLTTPTRGWSLSFGSSGFKDSLVEATQGTAQFLILCLAILYMMFYSKETPGKALNDAQMLANMYAGPDSS